MRKKTMRGRKELWAIFFSWVFFRVTHNRLLKGLPVVDVYPELQISQTDIFISLEGAKNPNSTTSRHGTKGIKVWSVLYVTDMSCERTVLTTTHCFFCNTDQT